jgi:hypothetical protein
MFQILEACVFIRATTPEDTEGCILVGKNTIKGQITQSRTHTRQLYDLIQEALEMKEEEVTIKIV